MSKEEEMAAIGRLVTAATDARKREALLKSDLEVMHRALTDAASALHWALGFIPNPDADRTLGKIPAAVDVLKKLAEYHVAWEEMTKLTSRLKQIGL